MRRSPRSSDQARRRRRHAEPSRLRRAAPARPWGWQGLRVPVDQVDRGGRAAASRRSADAARRRSGDAAGDRRARRSAWSFLAATAVLLIVRPQAPRSLPATSCSRPQLALLARVGRVDPDGLRRRSPPVWLLVGIGGETGPLGVRCTAPGPRCSRRWPSARLHRASCSARPRAATSGRARCCCRTCLLAALVAGGASLLLAVGRDRLSPPGRRAGLGVPAVVGDSCWLEAHRCSSHDALLLIELTSRHPEQDVARRRAADHARARSAALLARRRSGVGTRRSPVIGCSLAPSRQPRAHRARRAARPRPGCGCTKHLGQGRPDRAALLSESRMTSLGESMTPSFPEPLHPAAA